MGVIITGGRDFKRLLGSSRGLFVYLSTEYTDIVRNWFVGFYEP